LRTIDFESIKILYCTKLGTAWGNRRKRSKELAGFAEKPSHSSNNPNDPATIRNVPNLSFNVRSCTRHDGLTQSFYFCEQTSKRSNSACPTRHAGEHNRAFSPPVDTNEHRP
jgi:hypothetical protein